MSFHPVASIDYMIIDTTTTRQWRRRLIGFTALGESERDSEPKRNVCLLPFTENMVIQQKILTVIIIIVILAVEEDARTDAL